MKLLKLSIWKYRGSESVADRSNKALNEAIERMICIWDGTVHGQTIKNMYENDTDYESVCDVAGIDYEDYLED